MDLKTTLHGSNETVPSIRYRPCVSVNRATRTFDHSCMVRKVSPDAGVVRLTIYSQLSMESQASTVVKLEIYQSWWLWRGSRLCSRVALRPNGRCANTSDVPQWYFMLDDPMDQPGYNAATAFPSFKPNIECLGPPRRTRSQRGWYQVVAHPTNRGRAHTAAVPLNGDRRRARASDLPIELVMAVAEELRGDSLGECALVCRHWAAVIQAEIFKTVTIRDSQHAAAFLSFPRTPCSNVRHLQIQHFRFHHSLHSAPFVHGVVPVVPKLLPQTSSEDVVLELVGPLRHGLSTMRSVHCQLARQLPRETSTGIHILRLNNVHFRHFGHLIQLLYELPSIETIEGDLLTWPALTGTTAALGSPGLRRWLATERAVKLKVVLTHSTQYWPLLLLTSVAQRTVQDRTALCDLGQAIEGSLDQGRADLYLNERGSNDSIESFWACDQPSCLAFSLELKNARLVEIKLGCDEHEHVADLDWQGIQAMTLPLSHLERVSVLCPDVRSQTAAAAWVRNIGLDGKAARLVDEGKLWMSYPGGSTKAKLSCQRYERISDDNYV